MKNNFWGLIWSSLREVNNSILTILSYGLSIFLTIVAGKSSVPLYIVIIIVTVALLALATFFRALETTLEEYRKLKQSVIPKILRVQKDGNNNLVCLLESSNSFSIELLISFYYTDEDGFERLIGEGFVEYINPNDGRIQAVIDKPQTAYQAMLDRLASNDLKIIQETRVRLGVLRKHSSP
jgi:hypothetical protein